MQKKIVILDINGQKVSSIKLLCEHLNTLGVTHLIFSGVPGFMSYWTNQFKKADSSIELTACWPDNHKSSSIILLTYEISRIALSLSATEQDTEFLIISKTDGFISIKNKLLDLGFEKVNVIASVNNDFLLTELQQAKSMANLIKSVARSLTCENRKKPVLIATIANKCIQVIPELRDESLRAHLFGSVKFKNICESIGLKTDKTHVVKFD